MTKLTTEEKIDYIYRDLKKQKRVRYVSIFVKIALVLFVIYGYYKIIPNLDTSKYADTFTNKITKIIQPITEKMIKSIVDKETTTDNATIKKLIEEKSKSRNVEY